MAEFSSVARTGELAPDQGKVVTVNGIEVALFNVDGRFHAIDNTCVHRGGPLGEGACEEGVVMCPWHGWRYDVTSGQCLNVPGEEVERYEVRVEGDEVQVKV